MQENLSSVARARREEGKAGTAVVVDGFGLMHALFERCMPGWQWSLGGEYLFLDAALREWVEGLTKGGLSVVMCFDPAHGTEHDEEGHKGRKDYELISRFKERCAMLDKVDELRSCPPDVICICHDWIVVQLRLLTCTCEFLYTEPRSLVRVLWHRSTTIVSSFCILRDHIHASPVLEHDDQCLQRRLKLRKVTQKTYP